MGSLIVKTVSGWLKPFILLYGIHIILYGHLTPGGGFAGGAVAAGAFILIALAEGESAGLNTLSRRAASTWRSVGALLFLVIAGLGLVVTGTFFGSIRSGHESFGSSIQACEIGIGLLVCGSLYLVFVVLRASSPTSKSDGKGGAP